MVKWCISISTTNPLLNLLRSTNSTNELGHHLAWLNPQLLGIGWTSGKDIQSGCTGGFGIIFPNFSLHYVLVQPEEAMAINLQAKLVNLVKSHIKYMKSASSRLWNPRFVYQHLNFWESHQNRFHWSKDQHFVGFYQIILKVEVQKCQC